MVRRYRPPTRGSRRGTSQVTPSGSIQACHSSRLSTPLPFSLPFECVRLRAQGTCWRSCGKKVTGFDPLPSRRWPESVPGIVSVRVRGRPVAGVHRRPGGRQSVSARPHEGSGHRVSGVQYDATLQRKRHHPRHQNGVQRRRRPPRTRRGRIYILAWLGNDFANAMQNYNAERR